MLLWVVGLAHLLMMTMMRVLKLFMPRKISMIMVIENLLVRMSGYRTMMIMDSLSGDVSSDDFHFGMPLLMVVGLLLLLVLLLLLLLVLLHNTPMILEAYIGGGGDGGVRMTI